MDVRRGRMQMKGLWGMLALVCAASFALMSGCEPSAAGSSTSAQTSTSARSGTGNATLSITVTRREVLNDLKIKATLRATGGSGGYTWKITGNSSKGSLSSTTGTTTTYTAADVLEDYTQTVSVTDGTGKTATQTIWHNSQAGDIKSFN